MFSFLMFHSSHDHMAKRSHYCHRYDFLVCFNGTDLIFFKTFYSSLGIDHDPHVHYDHMIDNIPFYVSSFTRLYGQEKSLSYYDLFDFGVLI